MAEETRKMEDAGKAKAKPAETTSAMPDGSDKSEYMPMGQDQPVTEAEAPVPAAGSRDHPGRDERRAGDPSSHRRAARFGVECPGGVGRRAGSDRLSSRRAAAQGPAGVPDPQIRHQDHGQDQGRAGAGPAVRPAQE